jgi:hypothetical protein
MTEPTVRSKPKMIIPKSRITRNKGKFSEQGKIMSIKTGNSQHFELNAQITGPENTEE